MPRPPHLLHHLLLLVLIGLFILAEAQQEGKTEEDFPSLKAEEPLLSSSNLAHSRKKRYLAIPVGSNLEIKWSLIFPFNTFTLYRASTNLAIPFKIPIPDSLVLDENKILKRDLRALEGMKREDLQAVRKREDRWEKMYAFNFFENAFLKAGLAGQTCVLRAICEVAEAPFDQGMLGELVNLMFTPSLAGRPSKEEEEQEGTTYLSYLEAELQGRLAGRCGHRYGGCSVSPFDLVTNVMHMVA